MKGNETVKKQERVVEWKELLKYPGGEEAIRRFEEARNLYEGRFCETMAVGSPTSGAEGPEVNLQQQLQQPGTLPQYGEGAHSDGHDHVGSRARTLNARKDAKRSGKKEKMREGERDDTVHGLSKARGRGASLKDYSVPFSESSQGHVITSLPQTRSFPMQVLASSSKDPSCPATGSKSADLSLLSANMFQTLTDESCCMIIDRLNRERRQSQRP